MKIFFNFPLIAFVLCFCRRMLIGKNSTELEELDLATSNATQRENKEYIYAQKCQRKLLFLGVNEVLHSKHA